MAREINYSKTGAGAKEWKGAVGTGNGYLNERAEKQAVKILGEWNIKGHGGSSSNFESNKLSLLEGRVPTSSDFIICEDWQGIAIMAAQYAKAAGLRRSDTGKCCNWCVKCNRRAKIDKRKWVLVRDYALDMQLGQISGKFDTCQETELNAGIDEILAEQEAYVDELKGSGALSNTSTYITIGVATLATIFLTLKFVK
tara:strand:+ start:3029 stop:3622 length:594 start_codon:yes stop_codon:yes gene_type:complete